MRPSKSKNTDENVHGLKPTHGQSRRRFVTKETDVRSFPLPRSTLLLLFSVTAKRKKPSARARRGADQRASRRSRARDRRSPAERPPTRTMVRPRSGVVPARGRSSCPRRAFSGRMRQRPPGPRPRAFADFADPRPRLTNPARRIPIPLLLHQVVLAASVVTKGGKGTFEPHPARSRRSVVPEPGVSEGTRLRSGSVSNP